MAALADATFVNRVVFINGLVPLGMLGWDAVHGQLGPNPVEFVTHATGTLTLVFLLASLAVTPLRRAFGRSELMKARRTLGLYAFFYALLHLAIYARFAKLLDLAAIVEDTARRPFIALGMLSILLIVPLAATSTNAMVRRLGGRTWSRLHRLAYAAGIVGVAHYWMAVKADTRWPFAFAVALGVLLGYRLLDKMLPARV